MHKTFVVVLCGFSLQTALCLSLGIMVCSPPRVFLVAPLVENLGWEDHLEQG